jgi:thioredoxin reductase (NADPH)
LVIVDADPQARSATEAVLVRRFDPDYHIVTADSATTGLAVLEKLARQGAEVAIVAADLKLPGMDGVAFLELAHELHRDASRVLLLAMDRNKRVAGAVGEGSVTVGSVHRYLADAPAVIRPSAGPR